MSIHVVQRARDYLRETQNDDGGWGYKSTSQSVTEATAVAVIAQPSLTGREGGTNWLLRTQRADGSWGMNAQDDSGNWLTAWAALALLLQPAEQAAQHARQGLDWLLAMGVVRVTDAATTTDIMGTLNINPLLAGWPWQPDEASFVEPTALTMLAFTAAGEGDQPRLHEAIAYLRDRVCLGGGWNVGNPYMFRKPLPATPYSTAVALLAMKAAGADREDPLVSNGMAVLRQTLLSRVEASTLAWGCTALRVWHSDDESLRKRLVQMQDDRGGWDRSPYATASALIALQEAVPFNLDP